MNEPDILSWVDYLTAFGAIATPILVAVLGSLGWKLRADLERRHTLESKMRDERIQIYNEILEPFIILFISEAAWALDKKHRSKDKNETAIARALSVEYRKYAFKFSLLGSDGVVRAYNNLMQHFYRGNVDEMSEDQKQENGKAMMVLLGKLLLEVRKSMGNEATELDHIEMLEWFITDAYQYR